MSFGDLSLPREVEENDKNLIQNILKILKLFGVCTEYLVTTAVDNKYYNVTMKYKEKFPVFKHELDYVQELSIRILDCWIDPVEDNMIIGCKVNKENSLVPFSVRKVEEIRNKRKTSLMDLSTKKEQKKELSPFAVTYE